MRELKKSKSEVEKILISVKDSLLKEQENFNKCKDSEIKELYLNNMSIFERKIKELEELLK